MRSFSVLVAAAPQSRLCVAISAEPLRPVSVPPSSPHIGRGCTARTWCTSTVPTGSRSPRRGEQRRRGKQETGRRAGESAERRGGGDEIGFKGLFCSAMGRAPWDMQGIVPLVRHCTQTRDIDDAQLLCVWCGVCWAVPTWHGVKSRGSAGTWCR